MSQQIQLRAIEVVAVLPQAVKKSIGRRLSAVPFVPWSAETDLTSQRREPAELKCRVTSKGTAIALRGVRRQNISWTRQRP